jgi:hypothetical protein
VAELARLAARARRAEALRLLYASLEDPQPVAAHEDDVAVRPVGGLLAFGDLAAGGRLDLEHDDLPELVEHQVRALGRERERLAQAVEALGGGRRPAALEVDEADGVAVDHGDPRPVRAPGRAPAGAVEERLGAAPRRVADEQPLAAQERDPLPVGRDGGLTALRDHLRAALERVERVDVAVLLEVDKPGLGGEQPAVERAERVRRVRGRREGENYQDAEQRARARTLGAARPGGQAH